MNSLWMGTSWSDILGWLPALWDGLQISLTVTAVTLLTGIPLGLLLALAVQSKSRIIAWAGLVLVEIGRGTPALVLLQFIYFGLPRSSCRCPLFYRHGSPCRCQQQPIPLRSCAPACNPFPQGRSRLRMR